MSLTFTELKNKALKLMNGEFEPDPKMCTLYNKHWRRVANDAILRMLAREIAQGLEEEA